MDCAKTDLSILDSLAGQITVVNGAGLIVATNKAWRDTAAESRLNGRSWNYLDECDAAAARGCLEARIVGDGLRQVLEGKSKTFSAVYPCPFDQTHHWFKVTVTTGPGRGQALVEHTDVTDLHLDALTGLPNRAFFESELDYSLQVAASRQTSAGVVLVDLDDFKAINDRHGHLAGDAILQSVAVRLGEIFRKSDLVSRIGGDEFGVVLEVGTKGATAVWLAAKVATTLARTSGTPNSVGIKGSAGIAMFPEDGRSATDLLRLADSRMYGNKRLAAIA